MIERVTQLLNKFSQEKNPNFLLGQVFIVVGASYTGNTFTYLTGITSITPLEGTIFTLLTIAICKLVMPQFSKFFSQESDYRPHRLAAWTFSFTSAKLICTLCGLSLTLTQILWISAAYIVTLVAIGIIADKIHESQKLPPISKIPIRGKI